MKAIFIYKDGELFGSPIGYTTVKGAQKALVGTEDWYKCLRKYNELIYGKNGLTTEQEALGIYKWSEVCNQWMLQRELWSRKIWNEYVKEHYQFLEKEYEIVIKD